MVLSLRGYLKVGATRVSVGSSSRRDAFFARHAETIARSLLGEPNDVLSTKSQLRYGTNGSLAIEISGEKAGTWHDHENKVGGGMLDLIRHEKGCENGEAFDWLREIGIEIGEPQVKQKVIATYDYVDSEGARLYRVNRWGPIKAFTQSRVDPDKGEFVSGKGCMEGVRRVPYKLNQLDSAELVLIVEGEKDADRLFEHGILATCNPGGGGKWSRGFEPYFTDKRVVILPDNDAAGRDHARQVAECVMPVATSVKILELPDLPEKGDVSDWLAAGNTVDELRDLIEAAPGASEVLAQWGADSRPETVEGDPDLGDNVIQLASLRPTEYDRVRKEEAKRLGIRASTLDKEVERARAEMRPEDEQGGAARGSPLDLADVEPWPEPVDGAELLATISSTIRQYVVLSSEQADAAALWICHAHGIDLSWFNPRLAIRSPTKRCGKSTLLEIVSAMVPRKLATANVSAAAVFRTIEAIRPTLLIDEGDTFLAQNEELRGVLNAGHTRTAAFVVRVVPTGDGKFDTRKFSVWAPVVVAMIGKLPGTLADRSIEIKLQRKPPGEKVQRLRLDRLEHLETLGRKIARFIGDNTNKIKDLDPEPPAQLHDRAADNWRPLLAIAEAAGSDWPTRARKAGIDLSSGEDDSEERGVRLLADLKRIFDARGLPELFSKTLVADLIAMEDAPWSEVARGKPLTTNRLVNLLKPFGIAPKGTLRIGQETAKGYARSAFKDAWQRYTSSEDGLQNVTPSHGREAAPYSRSQEVTPRSDVTSRSQLNPAHSNACDNVTDREEGSGAREEFEL